MMMMKDTNPPRAADQGLCSRYIGSTIPLLPKPEISSLNPPSVAVQSHLVGNPKDRFCCAAPQSSKENQQSGVVPSKPSKDSGQPGHQFPVRAQS